MQISYGVLEGAAALCPVQRLEAKVWSRGKESKKSGKGFSCDEFYSQSLGPSNVSFSLARHGNSETGDHFPTNYNATHDAQKRVSVQVDYVLLLTAECLHRAQPASPRRKVSLDVGISLFDI